MRFAATDRHDMPRVILLVLLDLVWRSLAPWAVRRLRAGLGLASLSPVIAVCGLVGTLVLCKGINELTGGKPGEKTGKLLRGQNRDFRLECQVKQVRARLGLAQARFVHPVSRVIVLLALSNQRGASRGGMAGKARELGHARRAVLHSNGRHGVGGGHRRCNGGRINLRARGARTRGVGPRRSGHCGSRGAGRGGALSCSVEVGSGILA
mmetsp:Transcript_1879/g.5695  ORF Transcript_1879/g.5695 Transcript_1879/m.5695 type:complete len:209 (+) Transcript_1879:1862-2488(+)